MENLTELIEKLLEILLIVCEDIRNKISLQRSVVFLYVSNIQPEYIIENKILFCKSNEAIKYLKINISGENHMSRENNTLRRYTDSGVHCSTIYNSQDMQAT